jgi:hypothetical protein
MTDKSRFLSNQNHKDKKNSASDITPNSLQLHEQDQSKNPALMNALIEGERSAVTESIDSKSFLALMYHKFNL